jgi:Family of unknown function (DUF5677)
MTSSLNFSDTLVKYCNDLSEIVRGVPVIEIKEDDHLGFVAWVFLCKQLNHMEAIKRLYPHPDIQLISRTMLEGLVQLLWCFKYPEKAHQWRAFSWVINYRRLQEKKRNGENVSAEKEAEIIENFKEVGPNFLKKNNNTDDPYHDDWKCGKTVKDIFLEVEEELIHKTLYKAWSDWEHWGTESSGEMIYQSKDSISSFGDPSCKDELDPLLITAFMCLYQTLDLFNGKFQLGLSHKLESICEDLCRFCESAKNDAP